MNDIDITVVEAFGASLLKLLDVLADTIVTRIKDRERAPRWLNEAQAAERCATTRRVIADARRRGDLAARRRGRSYVFDARDLDAWLAPTENSRSVAKLQREKTDAEIAEASVEAFRRHVSSAAYFEAQRRREAARASACKCAGNRVNGKPCTQLVRRDGDYCGRCRGAPARRDR